MLSISLIASASENYYAKDSYYTSKEGEWQGKGAERLGLIGKVEKEDFDKLIKGKSPDGRFEIENGGNEQTHRPGIDLTLSAPKSVSIVGIILKNDRVIEAHRKAVEKTLEFLEKEFAQARITKNGTTEKIDTHNLIIAKFEHKLSRELDPQLHTHCVILNATERPDGKWRALSNEKIYENKILIGQHYRNELAANLKELGYAININEKGLFEIRGVEKKVIEIFSNRSEQINNKIIELKDNGLYPNANEQKLREIATLGSRVAKKDVDIEDIRQSWDERLKKAGYSKEQIENSIKEEFKKDKEETIYFLTQNEFEIVKQASKIIHDQESTFKKEEILEIAGRLSCGEKRFDSLERAFNELKEDKFFIKLDDNFYTTSEMKKIEKDIAKMVNEGKNTVDPIASKNQIDRLIENYEKEKNINLTEDQKKAVENILTSKDRFTAIQGDAGTGKTTSLELVRIVGEKKNLNVRGVGYTGRAANELEANALIKSQTLHSFLNELKSKEKKIVTQEEHSLNLLKYQKALAHFNEKDIKEVNSTNYKDIENKSGLRSLFFDTSTYFNKNTYKIKQETLKSLIERTIKEKINEFNILKSQEKFRKTYDVTYMNKKEEFFNAKQHVEITKNKDGKFEYTSYTLLPNRDIVKTEYKSNWNFSIIEYIHEPSRDVVKGRELWIIDEASMAGSKKVHEIMNFAEKAEARVVFVGDVKQLPSIEAGKIFKDLQERKDLNITVMKENIRQKDPWYRDAVVNLSQKKIASAIKKLEEQGKIHEIKDKNERFNRILNDFMSRNYKETIVITPRNLDRNKLNELIRNKLIEKNKISGKEFSLKIRESKNLSPSEKYFASSYEKGDIVISNRAGIIGRAGSEGIVISKNEKQNTITVITKHKTFEIDLGKHGENLAIFSEKEKNFARGDRIVCLKNDKSLGLTNGQVGYVKEIEKSGKIHVEFKNGSLKFNIKNQYNYIDYGYAVTDYKSQGSTASNVLYHCDTKKEISFNQAYVALTRGKEDVQIYTDNKEAFKEKIEKEKTKTSTLEYDKESKSETPLEDKGKEKDHE